jgi:hypothetical protein
MGQAKISTSSRKPVPTRADEVFGRRNVKHRTRNTYVFRGAVLCGVCDRRMQGTYSHGVAYYRCRFPGEYALAGRIAHPRNVYLREDVVVEPVDGWLAQVFDPIRLDATIEALAAAAAEDARASLDTVAGRAVIAECDAKLARYRAALDAGVDPAVVGGWIAQVQADRAAAEADLARQTGRKPVRMLTREEIAELVGGITDAVALLRRAAPEDKAEAYRRLGLQLTYHPDTQTVDVRAQIGHPPWGIGKCRIRFGPRLHDRSPRAVAIDLRRDAGTVAPSVATVRRELVSGHRRMPPPLAFRLVRKLGLWCGPM